MLQLSAERLVQALSGEEVKDLCRPADLKQLIERRAANGALENNGCY